MNTAEFAELIGATVIGNSPTDREMETLNVSIDSRSLHNDRSTLFFALTGAIHDGHDYIENLEQKGVRFFVVSKLVKRSSDSVFFLVSNTLEALQGYAAWVRRQVCFPVIAITGSRGKTIVKEWLNYLLSKRYRVIKSPKSYNSQIGVPLSVFGIQKSHSLGIFEAGISTKGEMQHLEKILKPAVGILTNIGEAHKEGFDSHTQKIQEKLKLFQGCEKVVLEYDEEVIQILESVKELWTWSFSNPKAMVFIEKTAPKWCKIHWKGESFELEVPFGDAMSLENTASCLTCLLAINMSKEFIQKGILNLYPVELRLQVKNGKNGCILIDDSYNSDYQSLKIALDFLEKHKGSNEKTIILSELFQSGFTQKELYEKVLDILSNYKVSRIIVIGEGIAKWMSTHSRVTAYETTEVFLQKTEANDFVDETILIKGARNFRFDRIVSLLEEKTHETVLEVNLSALRKNLNFYRSKVNAKTKIMVMVKAFGYGNGSFEIAKLLSHEQVDYLGVAFADEGVALRKAGIQTPIIVMNPEESAFSSMIAYDLEPEIYSLRVLKAFLKKSREKNAYRYPIHLKIDTGMHRLGFLPEEYDNLVAVFQNTNVLEVKSIFSHLAVSDEPSEKEFTLKQFAKFKTACDKISKELEIQPIRHILNTSGIFNYPTYQEDMVRIGIGLYGIGNSEEEQKHLEVVGTLKTIILQLRDVEEGESVGYGRRYVATRKTRIATLPIGYADGISRLLGNGTGRVYLNGQYAPIVGAVCMDMLMVDVTHISCKEGDEVELFGTDISVVEIATQIGTTPYEIMTGISQRVKRIFFEE